MTTADEGTAPEGLGGRIKVFLPYVVTVALFVAGAFALYHLLRPVDFQDVAAQVRATPPYVIALALLCTAGGYLSLVGYDWSALRYLDKKLPLPVVFMGGFLGYALGNTIGAGPVTGGAVRYRIYSALGLSAFDIAGIAVFGSLAFGLGTMLIGFGALVYHPQALGALISLDPATIRWGAVAVVTLALTLLVMVPLRKREFVLRGVSLRPPSLGIMLGQLVFTAIDILLAGITLYLLLPESDLGFATFMAVFAAALFAGVLSHVPGGIGVFEAVIIAALPATVPLEQAAAGLLLYRLIYFLIPFVAALILLAATEVRMARKTALGPVVQGLAPVFKSVSAITPLAMSAMVFCSGAFMLMATLIPPTSDLAMEYELLLPLAFVEVGALLSSIFGAALVVIAHGLLRRVAGAWWLAVAALAGGIMASLAEGIDYEKALILALALLILLPTRREFYRATRLTRNVLSVRWSLLMASLGCAVIAILFFAHKATPYEHELWWQFASDETAPRALRAALVACVTLALLILIFALRPGVIRHDLATPEDLERALKIIRAQPDPQANIALTGDKSLLFSESGRSFLMYRVQGRTWIALHEPFGDAEEFSQLAWAFHDAAYAANGRPVFYAVSAPSVPLWLDMGLSLVKMGEEAVVRLDGFSLEGSNRKRLRTTHNRAGRDGLRFAVIPAPIPPETLAVLKKISDEWLAAKSGGEKGFSVGAFDPERLARFPIATVTLEGRIVAFANLWLTDTKTEATIDLMRHVDDAPAGLMEFLFTELLLYSKAEGYRAFSLGNAPLAGLEARRGAKLSSRLGAFVYRHGREFYNFEGLRNFKNKFDPDWQPVYIALPPRANVLAVARDVVSLIGGGLRNTIKIGTGKS